MDANTIVTLVGTLGFPIVMCGALFWYMIKQTELHSTESREMRDAVNELKLAIVELTDRLREGADNERTSA